MLEINIANVLVKKRREKGITQDELANYIGVSKASVSKWETGQSYPDVTFLPLLAAYFDISIDDLMDYKPQMPKEDIRKLYLALSADFATQPFATVLGRCRQVVKKYYSCFSLLLQMGVLLINHAELAGDRAAQLTLIEEAKELLIRVRDESGEVHLAQQALDMEAFCCLAAGDASAVLDLLGDTATPAIAPEPLIASALQMKGLPEEAKTVLQAGIYQNIVLLFNYLPSYLTLSAGDPPRFDEALRRALAVSEAFDMKQLHPAVLIGLYLAAAHGFILQEKPEKAVDMLRRYADVVTGDIYPLRLKGDNFFDRIQGWLEELDLGTGLPRDEKTIRRSMADAVIRNPAFSALHEDLVFQSVAARLKANAPE
jgi:transcriptional regulator with XRE-family HTH domain